MMPVHPLLLVVLAQRLLELAVAGANTRRLRARGAIEAGAGHYPLMLGLHAAWWLSLALAVPADQPTHGEALAAFGALMALRIWVMLCLGPYWTTRILTLPGAPLVRRGPYAVTAHPNYWVVAGEVALLPLAFDAFALAVLFSALNGAMLAWRIAVEDQALAGRRLSVRGSSAASG
ncbi:MAG: isoprenylcysteine carboxyl methyltransferase family protein [Bacteroidales bacterium]